MVNRQYHDVRFEFAVEGVSRFAVLKFTFEEGLSTPFCGEISLVSANPNIDPREMLNKKGVLKVYQNSQHTRTFHGIIQRFERGDTAQDTRYKVTIVPEFARLSLRHNSRIFQKQTVIEILETYLSEIQLTDYELKIHKKHTPREYCVQYRENDLEYLHRILAEEGILYYFQHTDKGHKLIFTDHSPVTKHIDKEVLYDTLASGIQDQSNIKSLFLKTEIRPTHAVLDEYHFQSPDYTFSHETEGFEIEDQNGIYEHYDYPSRYRKRDVGKLFSEARIEYLRRDALTALGRGDIAEMEPGFFFELKNCYQEGFNRRWLLTHVKHEGEQAQAHEERATTGKTLYKNEFAVLPLNTSWKPTPNPKPQVGGPHVAVVTGPPGEEIYVDKYGRIKVYFKWDRRQTPKPRDESERTCWIRVSDGWAGAGRGTMALPRVGDEVIISFLEGDPDRPIVTGRTYHALNMQPYDLPREKTITGIKTKTYHGTGYNELKFDDATNEELIHIHAQKNMDTKVLNDRTTYVIRDHSERIGRNQKILVENDQTIDIIRHETETIGGNHMLTVKKNQIETVLLNKLETIGILKALTIGATSISKVGLIKATNVGFLYKICTNILKMVSLKAKIDFAGVASVLGAGKHLELACGLSKIVLTCDGNVYIKGLNLHLQAQAAINADGMIVNLNSGASQSPPTAPL